MPHITGYGPSHGRMRQSGSGDDGPPTLKNLQVRRLLRLASPGTAATAESYSLRVARTARRDVISLLVDNRVSYTEAEADALVAEAKRLAKESGRTVRAEAELLLSTSREARVRELRNKVESASKLLAAVIDEVTSLRAESGDGDVELADIMATMTASCAPFNSLPPGRSNSTSSSGEPPEWPAEEEPS